MLNPAHKPESVTRRASPALTDASLSENASFNDRQGLHPSSRIARSVQNDSRRATADPRRVAVRGSMSFWAEVVFQRARRSP